jgi:hypothetical protein
MDPIPGLKALQSRKRDLLLESDLNRQALSLELAGLRVRGENLASGFARNQGWLKWVAPVVGLFVARKFARTPGVLSKGSMLVSLAGAAWKLWKGFKAERLPVEPKT